MPEDSKPAIQALIEEALARVKDHECPCCGTNQWHPGWDVVPLYYAKDALIEGESGKGFGTVVFCCGGCGFIRLHSEAALRRLMNERDV